MATRTKPKASEGSSPEAATSEPEAETASTNGNGDTAKRTRKPGPTYALTPLDALPDHAKAERASRQVYMELLTPIVEDDTLHGEWFQVAEFNTVTGAKDAAKAIQAGERDVPVGEWDFEYRRLKREDGSRYSILCARFNGN